MKLLKGKDAFYIYYDDDELEAKIMKIESNGKISWLLLNDDTWDEIESLEEIK